MKKKQNIIISIAVLLILLALFFLPVQIPYKVNSVAKILPARQLILSRGNSGEIIVSINDMLNGKDDTYQIISPERGEATILYLDPMLKNGQVVAQGDTLGTIYSSNQQENLVQLNGELKVLKASLKVAMSGEKRTKIEESRQKLEVAKMEFEKQKKIVDRLKKLWGKNLISQEEYETQADELAILAKEVNVSQAELEATLSGEKDEVIKQLKEQISAVENEMAFLKEQLASENLILAPFSGRIDMNFSKDTLLIVSHFERGIAYIPVPIEDAVYINHGDSVSYNSTYPETPLSGEIQMKQSVMQMVGGKQCLLVVASAEPLANNFISGLLVPAEINSGSVSLPGYLQRNILN